MLNRWDARRRKRAVVAVAIAAAVVSVGGLAGSTFVKSPAQIAADAAPPQASVLTAPVVRRVLATTTVLRGTFTAGQGYPVQPTAVARTADGPGGGDPVVTGLPVPAGRSVRPGQVVAEVSGRPVFVLPGETPVYRDMLPGESGRDVGQLQDGLRAFGLSTSGDRHGWFGPGTKAAVARWYRRIGYAVPVTGDATAQAVQAAQTAVDEQRQVVADLRAQLAGGGADSASPSSGAATTGTPKAATAPTGTTGAGTAGAADTAGTTGPPDTPSAAGPPGAAGSTGAPEASPATRLARARAELARDRRALAEARAKDGPEVPSAEVLFLPSFPARVDSVTAHVGDHVTRPVLSLTAGGLNLTGHLLPADASLVKAGMKVTVLDETTGKQAHGRVGSIGRLVQPGAGGSADRSGPAEPYVPVTVEPDTSWDPSLVGEDVRITIVASSTAGEVLAVPAAAISSDVGGRTAVTVLSADGARRSVAVTPGVTADNYVQVTPAGRALRAGDRVVIGR